MNKKMSDNVLILFICLNPDCISEAQLEFSRQHVKRQQT